MEDKSEIILPPIKDTLPTLPDPSNSDYEPGIPNLISPIRGTPRCAPTFAYSKSIKMEDGSEIILPPIKDILPPVQGMKDKSEIILPPIKDTLPTLPDPSNSDYEPGIPNLISPIRGTPRCAPTFAYSKSIKMEDGSEIILPPIKDILPPLPDPPISVTRKQ